MHHLHAPIVKVPRKVNVYFKLNTRQNVVSGNSFFEMPVEDVDWTEEFVTEHMKLFRVEVPKQHTLMSAIDKFSTVKNLMVM